MGDSGDEDEGSADAVGKEEDVTAVGDKEVFATSPCVSDSGDDDEGSELVEHEEDAVGREEDATTVGDKEGSLFEGIIPDGDEGIVITAGGDEVCSAGKAGSIIADGEGEVDCGLLFEKIDLIELRKVDLDDANEPAELEGGSITLEGPAVISSLGKSPSRSICRMSVRLVCWVSWSGDRGSEPTVTVNTAVSVL